MLPMEQTDFPVFRQQKRPVSRPLMLKRAESSDVVFRLQDLAAAIHACFQVDVMGTAALAGIFVLNVGRLRQRVMGATLAALHARNFASWNGHWKTPFMPERLLSPWPNADQDLAGPFFVEIPAA